MSFIHVPRKLSADERKAIRAYLQNGVLIYCHRRRLLAKLDQVNANDIVSLSASVFADSPDKSVGGNA